MNKLKYEHLYLKSFDTDNGVYSVSINSITGKSDTAIIFFKPTEYAYPEEMYGDIVGKIYYTPDNNKLMQNPTDDYIPIDVLEYAISIAKTHIYCKGDTSKIDEKIQWLELQISAHKQMIKLFGDNSLMIANLQSHIEIHQEEIQDLIREKNKVQYE